MKMTKLLIVLSVCSMAMLVVNSAQAAKKPDKARMGKAMSKMVMQNMSEMTFQQEQPGISQANLWGDPSKAGYGMMKKYSAGTMLPYHSHSKFIRAVVLSGNLMVQVEGAAEKKMRMGSYIFLPGGTKHMMKCEAGADCIVFETQDGKYDMMMAASH